MLTEPWVGYRIVRGDLVTDRERFQVARDGEDVRLTPREFELLSYSPSGPAEG